LPHPAGAIASPQQAAGLGAGVGVVVNIAELGMPGDDCRHVRRALPLPPSLAQLADEVAFQLGRAGGEAGDVGKRQFLQPGAVQRARSTSDTVTDLWITGFCAWAGPGHGHIPAILLPKWERLDAAPNNTGAIITLGSASERVETSCLRPNMSD